MLAHMKFLTGVDPKLCMETMVFKIDNPGWALELEELLLRGRR